MSRDNVIEGSDYSLSAKDKYSNAHAAVYVYEAAMGFDGNYYKLSDEVAEALKTDGRCYTIKNIGKDYIIDVKEEDMIPNQYEITIPSGGDDYTILPEKEEKRSVMEKIIPLQLRLQTVAVFLYMQMAQG